MLTDILQRTPVRTVDEAVAVMQAIDARLSDDDGLKWFNRLYLRVTENVRTAVAGPQFQHAAFMAALDIVFANQYFSAIALAERSLDQTPKAWRPLFECRQRPGITRLQFALAGMNAHINRDLPAGIVDVFEALGGDPLTSTAERADFDAVNDILERVEREVKVEFSTGLIGVVDHLAGDTDDVAAMFKVRVARAVAWTNAQVMWTLRPTRLVGLSFFSGLDRSTGLASRALLAPVRGAILGRTLPA